MKAIQIILSLSLMLAVQVCFGQEAIGQEKIPTGRKAPVYVLKAGDKSVTVYPDDKLSFDLESIEAGNVMSMSVLKGPSARETYGRVGVKNGVVIIEIRDYTKLPEEMKLLLDKQG